MKTPDLIQKLSSDLTPKPVGDTLWKRFGIWVSGGLAVLALTFAVWGIRSDIFEKLTVPAFATELGIISVIVLLSGLLAVLASIPGQKNVVVSRIVSVLFAIWAVLLVGLFGVELIHLGSSAAHPGLGLFCFFAIAGISIIPAGLLIRLVRRGAPTRMLSTCVYIGLASSVLGAISMHFVCPIDFSMHKMVWHWMAILLVTVVTVIVGPRLLRW